MDGITYNGNPTSAVNQYNANKRFSQQIDRMVDGIDMAEKAAPKIQKQLDFAKDLLTSMKSDADAAIMISQTLMTIASENPIGKLVFTIYKEPIKVVFNLLLVNQNISDINRILDVFRDYLVSARKADNCLLHYDLGKYSKGPWTFLAKNVAAKGGMQLDANQAREILSNLNLMGTQLVAAHDVLLSELVPAMDSIEKFVAFCKNDINSSENKSIIDKLGSAAIDNNIRQFEMDMATGSYNNEDDGVLTNRNLWAGWCGLSKKSREAFLTA